MMKDSDSMQNSQSHSNPSINSTNKLHSSTPSLKKALSRELYTPVLPKKAIQQRIGSQNNLKFKKILEGEESEKEPDTSGILKWRWSRREHSEIFAVKFTRDGHFLAVAGGNGNISVYSTNTNSKEFVLEPQQEFPMPCNSIAFRPDLPSYKNKNVLAAAYSDGTIRHWHATSGTLMGEIKGDDVQILHISYEQQGSQFVTASTDNFIRVYDGQTHQLTFNGKNLQENGPIGHSNRVFCAKFHPKDPNMIVSGGWDDCIQVATNQLNIYRYVQKAKHYYRYGTLERQIQRLFGPHICGDAIDFNDSGSTIATGSYAKDNSLQLWDWSTGNLTQSIETNCLLYSIQYSRGRESPADPGRSNRFLLTAGSGAVNEMKMLSSDTYRALGTVSKLNCALYSVAMSDNDKYVALGGAGKMLMFFDLDEQIENNK
ncbi:WD40-repeat-containing domain protein [Globomyces pollinis-pini]|nr:WD40-repeat-containing domain protein [Globomyces pollinis-pini]